jgi:malonyl-CoA O-methyltransferase
MKKQVDIKRIEKNFSGSAKSYDEYASVQKKVFDMLKYQLEVEKKGVGAGFCKINKVLDVGCGTGLHIQELGALFDRADIDGVDISSEMIKLAVENLGSKGYSFFEGNIENICMKNKYDLIVSSATFQWLENWSKAFLNIKDSLCSNGAVIFSCFGPRTFNELRVVLEGVINKSVSIASSNFKNKDEIEAILRKLFVNVELNEEIITEEYSSLKMLLKTIKKTGTRGSGIKEKDVWTPEFLKKVEKNYFEKYKKIIVSYQIFFCKVSNRYIQGCL